MKSGRLISGVVLAALPLSGCGADSALLIVEVSGRPAAVQSLRLTVRLNEKQVTPSMQVTSSLDNFGLLLPPEPSGSFLLSAAGIDGRGCVIAQGRTDTTLMGRDRVRLSLAMTALRTPICSM